MRRKAIRRGTLFYADLDPVVGSEQGGTRPVLVLQNNVGNSFSPTVVTAAITSRRDKTNLPTHVSLENVPGLAPTSLLLLEQIRTVDRRRLRGYIGHISREKMKEIPFLKERLLEAREQQEENRKLCGRAYNKENLGYVCVDVIGNLIKPNYVSSTFGKLLEKHNMRHIRFHDLRHTCASLLLAKGVPMEQVTEWLGHSEISTTVDIYGHLQYATKKQSAAAIEQDIVTPMVQNLSADAP